MTITGYQRKHLRAPLLSKTLILTGELLLKCDVVNVSEGGILISFKQDFSFKDEIFCMVEIPQLLLFQQYKGNEILKIGLDVFAKKVFRISLQHQRTIADNTVDNSVDKKYLNGFSFLNIANDAQIFISVYVKGFAQNIIHLLKLLEQHNEENNPIIRHISYLLGYSTDLKISHLHQKVLHDYQGLQWA